MAGVADRALDPLDQLQRHHQKADTQRGEHGLGEGAEIDDAAAAIEALHRRDRLTAQAVLAVVVVLDDPGIVPLGDLQEPQPLVHLHDPAERPLAGGCHEDEPRRRHWRLQIPALGVDPQRCRLPAGRQEGVVRAKIAGLLHPEVIAFVHQQAADQVEAGLRTADDDDLLRRATNTPRGGEIVGDGLLQPRMAGDEMVAEQVLPRVPGVPGDQSRPGGERELRDLRIARMKGDHAGGRAIAWLGRHQPAAGGECRRRHAGALAALPDRITRQGGDPGAGADAGVQIAFGEQRVIGRDHGVAADTQLVGQRPGRRQPGVGLEPPGHDVVAQRVVELAVHRHAGSAVEHQHVEEDAGVAARQLVSFDLTKAALFLGLMNCNARP